MGRQGKALPKKSVDNPARLFRVEKLEPGERVLYKLSRVMPDRVDGMLQVGPGELEDRLDCLWSIVRLHQARFACLNETT